MTRRVDLSALPAGTRGRLLAELAPIARELGATIRTSARPAVELPPVPPDPPDLWGTTKTVVSRRGGRWVVERFDRHGERLP